MTYIYQRPAVARAVDSAPPHTPQLVYILQSEISSLNCHCMFCILVQNYCYYVVVIEFSIDYTARRGTAYSAIHEYAVGR